MDQLDDRLGALLVDMARRPRPRLHGRGRRAVADAHPADLDEDLDHAWALVRQARESARMNPRRSARGLREPRRGSLAAAGRAGVRRRPQHGPHPGPWARRGRGWQPDFRASSSRRCGRSGRAIAEAEREPLAAAATTLDELVEVVHRGSATPRLWPVYGGLIINLRNILDAMDEVADDPVMPLPARTARDEVPRLHRRRRLDVGRAGGGRSLAVDAMARSPTPWSRRPPAPGAARAERGGRGLHRRHLCLRRGPGRAVQAEVAPTAGGSPRRRSTLTLAVGARTGARPRAARRTLPAGRVAGLVHPHRPRRPGRPPWCPHPRRRARGASRVVRRDRRARGHRRWRARSTAQTSAPLAPVDPPCRFGFSSTPTRPVGHDGGDHGRRAQLTSMPRFTQFEVTTMPTFS